MNRRSFLELFGWSVAGSLIVPPTKVFSFPKVIRLYSRVQQPIYILESTAYGSEGFFAKFARQHDGQTFDEIMKSIHEPQKIS